MLNVDDYRFAKKDVIRYFNKNGISDDNIAEYAALAMVPIHVICVFIKEEFPDKEDYCDRKIREIREFYGY